MRKNKDTCRWRVEFKNIAYDGGGSSSWTQYYWTKLGAYISMYKTIYLTSWGGRAELYDGEEVELIHRIFN